MHQTSSNTDYRPRYPIEVADKRAPAYMCMMARRKALTSTDSYSNKLKAVLDKHARLHGRHPITGRPLKEYDPAALLLEIALDPNTPNKTKIEIHQELMSYMAPKRKAVEHSGAGGGAIQINVVNRTAPPKGK